MHKNASKRLTILLTTALLVFAAACKDKPTTPTTTDTAPKTEQTAQPSEPTETTANSNANPNDTFSSGLEKTKQISALTDEEKQQLLNATNEHVPPGMTKASLDLAMCTFGATISLGPTLESLTTDEMLQQACTQARDNCLEQVANAPDTMDISIFPTDCQATVAETEACLSAQNKNGASFLKQFPSCDTLTLEAINEPTLFAGVEALSDAPPECAPLAKKCPGFLTPPE